MNGTSLRSTWEDVSNRCKPTAIRVLRCRLRTHDDSEVEDEWQNLQLKIGQCLANDKPPRCWEAWIVTAATRLAIDQIRRKQRWRRWFLFGEVDTSRVPQPEEEPDPVPIKDFDDLWRRFSADLTHFAITDPEITAFELLVLTSVKTRDEIANELGISASMLSRALTKTYGLLRRLVKSDESE